MLAKQESQMPMDRPVKTTRPGSSPWGAATQPDVPHARMSDADSRPHIAPAVSKGLTMQSRYKSVFPGGGSGFRFKTADQIIREAFGTLSTLKSAKRPD